MGLSLPSAIGLMIHPRTHPTAFRGGFLSPDASSRPAEQCAAACPGVIVPHWRGLSGRSSAIRCFISSAVDASKRFFIAGGVSFFFGGGFLFPMVGVLREPPAGRRSMREEGVGAGFGESAHVVVLLLVALKRGREELIDLHRAVSCAPDHLDTEN